MPKTNVFAESKSVSIGERKFITIRIFDSTVGFLRRKIAHIDSYKELFI